MIPRFIGAPAIHLFQSLRAPHFRLEGRKGSRDRLPLPGLKFALPPSAETNVFFSSAAIGAVKNLAMAGILQCTCGLTLASARSSASYAAPGSRTAATESGTSRRTPAKSRTIARCAGLGTWLPPGGAQRVNGCPGQFAVRSMATGSGAHARVALVFLKIGSPRRAALTAISGSTPARNRTSARSVLRRSRSPRTSQSTCGEPTPPSPATVCPTGSSSSLFFIPLGVRRGSIVGRRHRHAVTSPCRFPAAANRKHTGEKPYQCPLCQNRSVLSSSPRRLPGSG